jgi:hypothetical protein
MSELSAQSLEAYAALGGLAVAILGLGIVVLQLRGLEQSVRTAAHSAVYFQSAELRAHLVAHPQLRRYFFDGAEIDPGHADYDRVATIAEIYLNCLEQVTVTIDGMGLANRPALEAYVKGALAASPILRRRLESMPWSYSRALGRFL